MHREHRPRDEGGGLARQVDRGALDLAGLGEAAWIDRNGEVATLEPEAAGARARAEAPLVCHARATARRLGLPGFAAFDLLELFAFVRPASFCVPTPRGLAAALGLAPPVGLSGSLRERMTSGS